MDTKKSFIRTLALAVIGLLVLQILLSTGILDSYYQITFANICLNIILASSLNLVTGFTGQFSLGHAGFMSIGAYACAIVLLENPTPLGFVIGIVLAMLLALLVGILIGIPTLRLKGDYLAIATLGLAEIIRVLFLNMKITNGAAGLSGIPQFATPLLFYLFAVATLVLLRNFIQSSPGRACISIREDEIASESMGINTTKYKVVAFAIGAAFAGLAGALYSANFYVIKPTMFGFMKSIDILVIVVLGGMGSLSGTILASILIAILNTYLQSFAELRMIIYSVILILIMIFRPQGIMGTKELSLDVLRFRKKTKE